MKRIPSIFVLKKRITLKDKTNMATFLSIISIAAAISIVHWLKEWWENKEDEREMEAIRLRNEADNSKSTEMDTQKQPTALDQLATRELAKQVLKTMGCRFQEKDELTLVFEYQGITFFMEVVNDCLFVNLIWPWCHSISMFDIDEIARVQKVINEINSRSSCTIFHSLNQETDEVAVHVRKNFIFAPQIPQLEEYLSSILRTFFAAVRELDVEIEKARLKECEA